MSSADFGDFEDGQSPLWERLPTTSGSRCVLPQHYAGTSYRLASVWGCRAGPSRARALTRPYRALPAGHEPCRWSRAERARAGSQRTRADDREVDIHLPVAAEQ